MRVIIDRFEGDFAVCEQENKEFINIEQKRIPATAKEGDVLLVEEDDIRLDVGETEARRRKIKELAEDLWE